MKFGKIATYIMPSALTNTTFLKIDENICYDDRIWLESFSITKTIICHRIFHLHNKYFRQWIYLPKNMLIVNILWRHERCLLSFSINCSDEFMFCVKKENIPNLGISSILSNQTTTIFTKCKRTSRYLLVLHMFNQKHTYGNAKKKLIQC